MVWRTHYELLGVSPSASPGEIKVAYYELAKRYHPDLNQGHTDHEELLKEINAAYDVLSNPLLRATYDLLDATGTAHDTDRAKPNYAAPEWEPTAEQLRDIYNLDDAERAQEIERLCKLHPHLVRYFEERPPPPRFYPSDEYVHDFRARDRNWRLTEIDRQCAHYPHLRAWFADIEEQCGRAEEQLARAEKEAARLAALSRQRAVQYESERVVYAGIAFASLGGMLGLAIGFVPCWLIGQVVGIFSGALGTSARQYQAFEDEKSWYWPLWILCGLVGMGLFFFAQLQEKWLHSSTLDPVAIRWKGMLIAVPCIAASVAMIFLAASSDAGRLEFHVGRQKAQQTEAALPLSINGVTIDGVYLYANSPNATVTILSQFPQIRIELGHAHLNDRMVLTLVNRYGPNTEGGQNKGSCQFNQLPLSGAVMCNWNVKLDSGYYFFDLHLANADSRFLGRYYFAIGGVH